MANDDRKNEGKVANDTQVNEENDVVVSAERVFEVVQALAASRKKEAFLEKFRDVELSISHKEAFEIKAFLEQHAERGNVKAGRPKPSRLRMAMGAGSNRCGRR
jgi:hypothetical protein